MRHRLPIVEVRQDDGIAEAITTEPALIQHLPGGEGAATGVPGQAEQPHALLCRGRLFGHHLLAGMQVAVGGSAPVIAQLHVAQQEDPLRGSLGRGI